ncbi:MAG: hypothetical protein V7697_03695 [Rhodococcus erythropolis]
MAELVVTDAFGDRHEFPETTFRTDDSGTNNLELYGEDGHCFGAFNENHWVSAVIRDG